MSEASDQTILAIDYGSRRIGLAKSDPTGLIASPIGTLEVTSRRDALSKLRRVIDEIRPTAIVIGYPLLASGDMSDKCLEIDRFIEQLTDSYSGPLLRVDEAHSSTEAHQIIHAHGKRVGRQKKRIDKLAAVIILQRYLDETRNQ
ncbi:Holliday junction resolvase RuvX [candidate division GN15 bacterium]|uniref:Putative pre-16S rRNA nuclease n=1 Tax=candidate division GN15 bacterium TaxID=2072418 RepID=A0A855X9H1_9BACT|nr:MAG: Holliday junction resolvase RuvX [candidate division GN15 bacterium]